MRDLLDAFEGWRAGGRRAALARLVDVSGQFPGRVGAALAVSEDGEVAGSLDHPGIEDAVVEAAGDLLAQAVGAPAASRILMWDGRAVLLGRADWSVLAPLVDAVRGGRDVALAVQTGGPGTGAALLVGGHGRLAGSLGHDRLDAVASADALGALALGRTTTHHYGPHGERHGREVAVFVESFNRPPRLVVLGVSGLAGAVVRVASAAGFRVTVCDPGDLRSLGQLGPGDAVCVLSGDPRRELVAVTAALATGAGYVAALGGPTPHEARLDRLRGNGVAAEAVARLAAPVEWTDPAAAVVLCADIMARRRLGAPPPPSFR